MSKFVIFSILHQHKPVFNVSVDLDESCSFKVFVQRVFLHFRVNADNQLAEFLTFMNQFNYHQVSPYKPVFGDVVEDFDDCAKIEFELDTRVVRYGENNYLTAQNINTKTVDEMMEKGSTSR